MLPSGKARLFDNRLGSRTTSDFRKNAFDYVKNIDSKNILIDGQGLTELMIEHNVGVSSVITYKIKKIGSDYFIED